MKKTEKETLQNLFEIAKSLTSTLDIDTLLKRIGESAEQLTDSEASSIMLLDEDKQHLSFKVATGEKGGAIKKMKVKVGEGIAGTVAKTKESLIINDVSKDPRFSSQFDKSSGFKTKSILAVPLLDGEEVIGVAEVLNKKNGENFTEDDKTILQSLASLATVSIINAKFAEDQKNFFIYMIEIIVQAIEGRNPKLSGHTWKVAQLSTAIAKIIGIEPKEYKDIYYGALLHDIGYISLKKTEKEETIFSLMEKDESEKTHPILGWEMVKKINILRGAADLVLTHHEYYDGSGFPQGLKGENIPIGGRIIGFAEFIEDLKLKGHSQENIKKIVEEESGKKLDPQIVKIYLSEIAPTLQEASALT